MENQLKVLRSQMSASTKGETNPLCVFEYEGNEVRTVQRDGETWWVLKDVCDILELSNPSMIADRLDDDEKVKVDPKQYLGSRSNEHITIISESGLYNVIILSHKPEAKKFKRRVTLEVLPVIHKTGKCMMLSDANAGTKFDLGRRTWNSSPLPLILPR